MKKKFFYAFLVILLLIGVLFGVLTYLREDNEPAGESNQETQDQETPTTDTTEQISLSSEEVEKFRTPFIEANIEFTCLLIKNPGLSSDQMLLLVNEIYEKHSFPIEENETMFAVLRAYENDEEVTAAIQAGVEECS